MVELPPWVRMDLQVCSESWHMAVKQALDSYPKEACGFFLGPREPAAQLDEYVAEQNEADKYHRLDPTTFPRTGETYFKLNELRAQRRFKEAEEQGRAIKVIFHSHCDAGAYFSEEDAATFAREGQLMWPCAFIVLSVVQGIAQSHSLWCHRPDTNAFDAFNLRIGA